MLPRRRIHRTLPSLVAAALLLAGLLLVAAPAQAVSGILPTLKCVTYDRAQNQVTATFGYLNANATTQTVPVGATNFFFPLAVNQGQPSTFLSGSYEAAFTVSWSLDQAASVSWSLLGTQVTATALSPSCTGRFSEDPSLVGMPTVEQTISLDLGVFVPGNQPYADPEVSWTRDCDTASPIIVGSGTSYAVQADDAGHRIGATVTWTTSDGSETVGARTACGSDALAGIAPAPSRLAHLSGDSTPGSVLSVDAAWTGTAPLTQSITWERCDTTDCTAVGSDDTYTVTADDVGYQLRATVVGTNPWGSGSSVTPSVIVAAPPAPPAPPAPSGPPAPSTPPTTLPMPAHVDAVLLSARTLTLRGRVGRLGPTKTLRITNATGAPVTVGAVVLAGPRRREFRVVGGTCAKRTTLAASRTCTVRMALKARAKGVRRATLRVPVQGRATLLVTLVGRARR